MASGCVERSATTEVERLFNLLGDGKIDSHQNWKGRFKDNSDRMRTGSIYDVVEVLKSLTFLSKSKSLSFREKRMLDRAKFLVVSEITEVLGEKTPQVEEKVDQALERCFVVKARNAARAKAAKATRPAAVAPPRGSRGCTRGPASRRTSLVVATHVSWHERSRQRGRWRQRPCCRLYVLICGPVLLLWTLVTRRAGVLYAAGALGIQMGFALAGIRLRVVGAEHIRSGAAVYACNHSSNIDPPAVFLALRPLFPRLRVLYKAELRKLPVLVWAFDAGRLRAARARRTRTRAGRRSIGRPRRCARATRS